MMYMADPLQVLYWERKLNIKLTEAQKAGTQPVEHENNTIYLELKQLYFPDDLMDEITLLQINKKPKFDRVEE